MKYMANSPAPSRRNDPGPELSGAAVAKRSGLDTPAAERPAVSGVRRANRKRIEIFMS
jgi:hypothetical protein